MKTKAIAGIITLFLATLMTFNVMPASAQPINIVVNGSFEQPLVTTTQHWDIYTSEEIPGWYVEWMLGTDTYPDDAYIELQKTGGEIPSGWTAAEGDQWAELDSDWDGPGGGLSGEPASIRIYQDLTTAPGVTYTLRFAFSPRPGVADNKLQVKWAGEVVDTISADGSGLTSTDWRYYEYNVAASGTTTRLEFADLSNPDSLGTFLDDVSIIVVKVEIDIKPESDPNSICLGDHGLLPVAILGSDTFDVNTIDPESIEIGGVDLASRGSPKAPKLAFSYEDVNGDGYMDLVAFFEVQELPLTETTVALTLTATLFDGTPIIGTDSVRVVPP